MSERKVVGKKYEYQTNDKLGSGAFAEVYFGKNKLTQEAVAIKVIKRAVLAKYGDEILQQIHQEVEILQELVEASKTDACPFINRIYECLETTNNIYIVLEFCNQGTLLDQIKKTKKLEENEALFILFQLLQALTLLAKNNIAHRDIKPENIFIKDGVYKLGDFGFAGQKSMYQTHLGTFPYMAPEFFTSDQYDSKVDVWALGLLSHEMLFGEIYFIGKSQFEVQQKILTKQYILDDQKYAVSDGVKELLKQMITKDPQQRITARDALKFSIFDKFRTDPRYITIMENEKQFMKQFDDDTSQKSSQQIQIEEEERQKREEEEKAKQLQMQLDSQKAQLLQQGIKQITDGIKDKLNGILLMVQLSDFLSQNVIEICRFEILYILKQAAILISQLKEKMDDKYIFGKQDHIKFDVDQEIWNVFYTDASVKQLIDDIEGDRTQIRKKYIDYLNYINNFTNTNYRESMHYTEQITNVNFTKLIEHQLYNEQLYQKIKFFKEDKDKVKDENIRKLINKCLLWMYAAYEYQKLCSGQLMDIMKFMEALNNDNTEEMKNCIKWP
ncbi:unnamed protein product [Paramecium pentaurelia]|uniref:Protein kinase domain-containing protein n=1 Tax=Paramecium pentaurelia TaxID=43138 RepID=A0A8S1UYI9_9CILI|nr:unnamed protein product [Paramecium pentaurelia]